MKSFALTTVKYFIAENLIELRQFLKSISFSRALRVGIAVTLPVLLGIRFDYFEIGLALSFGAFWSSPSDVIGSLRHKNIGILVSAGLIMLVSFIKAYLYFDLWILLPVLGFLTFCIAFISIYGFRASLVSFSGLMALALSFARDSETLEIYQYSLLIGLGGFWYIFLSKIWHTIDPKAETEEFLSETFLLTADFLDLRGQLLDPKEDSPKIQSQLVMLQEEITKNHEALREILILSRKTSGLSNYQNKRLLIFIQLIEMLETSIANPVNYQRMDVLFMEHPKYLKSFQGLILEMSYQLRAISIAGNDPRKLPTNDTIKQCFSNLRADIDLLLQTRFYEEYLMFQNLIDYQLKQYEKLKRIKLLLGDIEASKIDIVDRKNAKRFLAVQDYDPSLLRRNFSFKSTIFRHSCRLAVTVMIGYALGSIFAFQNPYSILLIVIVIMRPSYGLTRSRAKDRLIGTLIGASIAFAMLLIIQNIYVYGVLGVISLVVAISLIQKNYRASATFITLSAVLIYAILSVDAFSLIKFRMLGTFIGAGLSYLMMRWLWPSWEFNEMNVSIENSVEANKKFLHKITEYYLYKGEIPTSYNIARKDAFLETSNLSSQEPKSKQREMDKVYELVVLNHTFLSSLASLSVYIQQNKTTDPSEHFKIVLEKIENNLERVLQCLVDQNSCDTEASSKTDNFFEEQLPIFNFSEMNDLETKDKDRETLRQIQETHLVWEHLEWLFSISNKTLKIVTSVKLN